MDRRELLKSGGLAALGLGALGGAAPAQARAPTGPSPFAPPRELVEELRAVAARPVVRADRLGSDPVLIESIDILRREGQYLVRVRDRDGAEGWTLTNSEQFPSMYPLLRDRIAPLFIGRDARELEALLSEAYLHDSNYKWQGLALWSCMARLELAVLDLLGKRTGEPINRLLGDRVRDSTGIYFANGNRDNSAEWVVERLQRDVARSGARALKFKIGARMRQTEASDARDRKLIPLVREAFGPDVVLYADANGSYTVDSAIHFGTMLEDYRYGFFEEPVPFDHLVENKLVADALSVPIAGGEQDSSLWSLEWHLAADSIQIIQPDLIYFGGLIRSMRVARMAEALGKQIVPHISGRGLGSLYVTHFASLLPNTTDYQEYKGDPDPVPYEVTGVGGRFVARDGRLPVPTGPGLGITFDPGYLGSLEPVPV